MDKLIFELCDAVNKYKIFIKCDDSPSRCYRCNSNILDNLYTDGARFSCFICASYTNKLYKESFHFLKNGNHI